MLIAMNFLGITKIITAAIAVLSLPLILIGGGIFITVPLVGFVVVVHLITRPNNDFEPSSMKRLKMLFYVSTVIAGLGCFIGLYKFGATGFLKSDGKTSLVNVLVVAVVCLVVTVVILVKGNQEIKQTIG